MRALAAAMVSVFLLAGCSSPGPDDGDAAAPAPTYRVTGDNRIVVPVVTDTYHLLALPDATPVAPTAQEPIRVPVPSIFQETLEFPNGFRDTWNMTLPNTLVGFVGEATLVVEVTGGVAGNPFPTSGGCFWALGAVVDGVGGAQDFDFGCLPEGAQVPAGLYTLAFPFAYPEARLPAGSVLHLEFHTNENIERPPGSAVELLTASVPYDSVLRIQGLEVPLDEALLLR